MKTGSARPMKRPLSTTPTMRPIRFSSRAGSEIWPKPQSRMRLPLSVTKGSPVAVSRSLATDPSAGFRALVTRPAGGGVGRVAVYGARTPLGARVAGSRDPRRGPRGGRLARRDLVLAAVDLDHRVEAALGAEGADAPDLWQHLRQEG